MRILGKIRHTGPHLIAFVWAVFQFGSISSTAAFSFLEQSKFQPHSSFLSPKCTESHIFYGSKVKLESRAKLYSQEKNASTDPSIPASNSSFSQAKLSGITLKVAFDQTGGVADLAEEKSERFTCPESLDMVHRLRRDCDAVLVGRQTVVFDDCTLTVRRVPPRRQQPITSSTSSSSSVDKSNILDETEIQPTRIVIDPYRKLDLDQYKLATDGLKTIIYYMLDSSSLDSKSKSLHQVQTTVDSKYSNVIWVGIPGTSSISGTSSETTNQSERISAQKIVEHAKEELNLHHILVEGGPTTAHQFLQEKCVDRAILVYAPMTFVTPVPSHLSSTNFEKAGLSLIHETTVGVDRVEYWCRNGEDWPQCNNDSKDHFWP